ncbi:hypothetical protein SAMN05421870_1039 [Streptomyces qinglanensis]|uniref:Uncharacterized protein n=1 Tax=Streptomyces qinglanensis TaxID=943816 RepID=A0A1H9QNY3_9ACTN|nr:hypothetical protein SAMN05421870_1039 [Streptomyces qinglanensis]
MWVSEDVKDSVTLDGSSGECQAECGFKEEACGLGFESRGVGLGPAQGDSIQRGEVVPQVPGVVAQSVKEVSDDARPVLRRECFGDEGCSAVWAVETIPGSKESLGRAEPQSRGGKFICLGKESVFAAEVFECGGVSAAS